MTVRVNMLDWFRTADFGGIKLGISRDEVERLLGEPPDWSVTRRRKQFQHATIWRYGSIEFYFSEKSNTLEMIFSDHFPLEGCTTLQLNPWILREFLPLPDTLDTLDRANLNYQLTENAQFGILYLTLESGVSLYFSQSDDSTSFEDSSFELTSFCLRVETKSL